MPKAAADSYVILRENTFHYRRRVPADVVPYIGQKWWKRSLKTGSKQEAERKARALGNDHDRLIAEIKGLPLPDKREALLETIDYARDALSCDPTDKAAVKVSRLAGKAVEKVKRAMFAAAEQRLDTLPDAERDEIKKLGGIESFFKRTHRGADAVETERIYLALQQAVGSVSPREADEHAAVLQARARQAARDQSTLAKLRLTPSDDRRADDPNNPRIKTAVEIWFAERKQGHYSVKRHRIAINRFVELHGNIAVRDITKQMVRDYLKTIENLPDQRRIPAKMRGGLADPAPDVPRVAAPTVERHLITIKALLTFAMQEKDWISANVATGLRAPKDTRQKASRRRSFTRDERNRILARAIEEYGDSGDMAWLVRLGAYTGCRLEELAQLARSNIRKIDDVWVVEIDDLEDRNLKSSASVKVIPLHSAICDEFVAWVTAGKGARVFASFKAGKDGRFANVISGDFGRLMDRAGLADPRLVFHSWRHTLKREMSNARIDPDVRRVILGHAAKDAHDGYDGHSHKALAEEFGRLPPLFD